MSKKQNKLEELEKRIVALEQRQVQHYPILPVPIPMLPQPPYQCPICGSAGGCLHVTC